MIYVSKYKETTTKEQSAYPTNCEVIYNSKCTEAATTFLELFKEIKVVSFCDLCSNTC